MLGNSKNLFAIGVFRDFQHRYTYVLIKKKVILITESNRLQIITVTLSFQTYTISIDTPIDYIKKSCILKHLDL